MRKRTVSYRKKEIHLTILVDAEGEEFKKITSKIRTEVMKHNRRPENERKVSYDIIHAESPGGHRIENATYKRPEHQFGTEREITWSVPVRRRETEWPGAILNVDEEVQGSKEEIFDLNELKEKVNKLLDERVTAIVIKKARATQGDSCKGTI